MQLRSFGNGILLLFLNMNIKKALHGPLSPTSHCLPVLKQPSSCITEIWAGFDALTSNVLNPKCGRCIYQSKWHSTENGFSHAMEETQGKKAIMLGGLSDLDLNLLEDFGL